MVRIRTPSMSLYMAGVASNQRLQCMIVHVDGERINHRTSLWQITHSPFLINPNCFTCAPYYNFNYDDVSKNNKILTFKFESQVFACK